MAAGDVSKAGKKFMVVMNAATSVVTTKSPYMTRTSMTIPQLNTAFGKWVATHTKVKKVYTMVSDYGPGHDAEQSFQKGFKEGGGTIVGSVRMAVANPDFSAYVQKAKDLNPQGIFVFIPGRRAAGRLRQGFVGARHRPEEDPGHGPDGDHRRARAQGHGRHLDRHHDLGQLRL